MEHARKIPVPHSNTLSDQWQQFANDDRARVLVWRLELSDMVVASAFLEMELDERTREHPDTFVELGATFTSADVYSQCLTDELIERYFEHPPCLAPGMGTQWTAPARNPEDSDAAHLARSCAVFAAHCGLPRHLVLAIEPRDVYDHEGYRAWLVDIARVLPASVRILVFDFADAAEWRLSDADAERVIVRPAALRLNDFYADVAVTASDLARPGDRFRQFYMGLMAALEQHDLLRVFQHSRCALAVSEENDWFHLGALVHCKMGEWLRLEGYRKEAKEHYRDAEECAVRGWAEGPPELRDTCSELRLNSRVGYGTTMILDLRFADAARFFEITNLIAADHGDSALQLDCCRLAAFSHERAGSPDAAFLCAYEGFQLAKHMPPKVRDVSCLPFLAATLLWLCERTGRHEQRAYFEREFAAMVPADMAEFAAPD